MMRSMRNMRFVSALGLMALLLVGCQEQIASREQKKDATDFAAATNWKAADGTAREFDFSSGEFRFGESTDHEMTGSLDGSPVSSFGCAVPPETPAPAPLEPEPILAVAGKTAGSNNPPVDQAAGELISKPADGSRLVYIGTANGVEAVRQSEGRPVRLFGSGTNMSKLPVAEVAATLQTVLLKSDAKANGARVTEATRSEAAPVEAAPVEAARVEAARVEAARVETARVEPARGIADDDEPAPGIADEDDGPRTITFDTLKFDIEKDAPFKREMLPEKIEKLAGQKLRVSGYILPSFKQSGIKQFVLVRDNQECCFGPGAAIYDCIRVQMKPGESTEYVIRPVTVTGTFSIRESISPTGRHMSIYHLEGESVR